MHAVIWKLKGEGGGGGGGRRRCMGSGVIRLLLSPRAADLLNSVRLHYKAACALSTILTAGTMQRSFNMRLASCFTTCYSKIHCYYAKLTTVPARS